MRSSGVYEIAKPKLVFGENVSQALQFVQSGSADIGVVALSLALAPTVGGRFWEVPTGEYPRMEQGGTILQWASSPDAARALRSFLLGDEARAILKRYGFDPVKRS